MGLEAGTYINDLDVNNPDGADARSQGDNHLRLIKATLKNTFPGMAGRAKRIQSKSGNYLAVLNDNDTMLFFTAAGALTLTPAATLGNGWGIYVVANGGAVTIDPDGTELVNGGATLVVPIGNAGILFCDASGFQFLYVSAGSSQWDTGDVKLTLKSSADVGWVMMNDGSIGSASSGATTRANADTERLFTLLWNNISNTWAPVSGGRGANAAADWAANKNITLPKTLGRALASAGAGAGLTSRALGENLGAETHQLTQAETPVKNHFHLSGTLQADSNGLHQHTERVDGQVDLNGAMVGVRGDKTESTVTDLDSSNTTGAAGTHTHTVSGQTANASDATASGHNNMPPETFLNVMIKL